MWHNFKHNQINKNVKYKIYCLLSYSTKAIYIHVLDANMFLLYAKYGKKYEPEEETFCMKVYMENK